MGIFHHTGGSPLNEVPTQLDKLTNLEILDLSRHHILELPKEISNLKKLKSLGPHADSTTLPADYGTAKIACS